MANPDSNAQVIRRWLNQNWNEKRVETVAELMATDARGHAFGVADYQGHDGFKAFRSAFLDAIPDMKLDIVKMISEGENVVVHWHVQGTHLGDSLGIPATKRPVDFWGITWFRVVDGKVAEGWDAFNNGEVLRQLTEA